MQGDLSFVDSVTFTNIGESLKAKYARRTEGSTGPSGLDESSYLKILG